ncbi:hypothetical protein H3V53_21070 [Paraburkholderia bengalensis]|uniref:Tyr recombinase domain-containing protein n=1 Tax=Paraburkholderia bengalensis TaxID=2747562 RepID=A0ABU8IVF0_9BURK
MRSVTHVLSALGTLLRWPINPFADVDVRGSSPTPFDASRARRTANVGAQRLRFLLDFGYTTGLRTRELVDATLAHAKPDARVNTGRMSR